MKLLKPTRTFILNMIVAAFCFHQFSPASAQSDSTANRNFYVDRFSFDDHVFSHSKKTELGDRPKLETTLKYNYDENSFGTFRLEIDPEKDTQPNKTSKFELLLHHNSGQFQFQLDVDLKTDDNGNGSASLGPDLDSKHTYVLYKPSETFSLGFYPFNFGGEVGEEFYIWDVTRVYYIDSGSTTVASSPLASENIQERTIPGLTATFSFPELATSLYFGAGAATILYPANADYDLENNPNVSRWERIEDIGYKAGFNFGDKNLNLSFKYAGHQKADEAGSLLKSAASLNFYGDFSGIIVKAETAMSQAGNKAYRLESSSKNPRWFKVRNTFKPIYSDFNSVRQDWLGKTDFAESLKLGFNLGTVIPYAFYKYQGPHFLFSERESAHQLRTNDEALSHGGLQRAGFGTYVHWGKIYIKPEVEWFFARNPVFTNSGDVRADRFFSDYDKTDLLLSVVVKYSFDGFKEFEL